MSVKSELCLESLGPIMSWLSLCVTEDSRSRDIGPRYEPCVAANKRANMGQFDQ